MEVLREERLQSASLLILANKQDLSGAKSAKEIEEILETKSMGNRNIFVSPCSAVKGGEGLTEGINWLVEELKTRVFTHY